MQIADAERRSYLERGYNDCWYGHVIADSTHQLGHCCEVPVLRLCQLDYYVCLFVCTCATRVRLVIYTVVVRLQAFLNRAVNSDDWSCSQCAFFYRASFQLSLYCPLVQTISFFFYFAITLFYCLLKSLRRLM